VQSLTIPDDANVYVAGHRGLVGSAVMRRLATQGRRVEGRRSTEVDLRDRSQALSLLQDLRPSHVVLAAAKVGGILANATAPADFLSENLRIQVNVMDAAHEADVDRLVFLGSSCIYPKLAVQPIHEDSLLTGPLEPTNDAYAIAKIAGIMQVQAVRRQHGRPWISAMPTNLYGPGDNFDLEKSHVLPAMIRRMHEAKMSGARNVTLWGTGAPRREFLHVDDLADAVVFLLENYDDPRTINVGTGTDVTIKELAELVQRVVGFEGNLVWDADKPDGTPRKLLDVSRLTNLGWTATITLEDGVRSTYAWFLEHVDDGSLRA
jgi:GDP-L-fucose synthase